MVNSSFFASRCTQNFLLSLFSAVKFATYSSSSSTLSFKLSFSSVSAMFFSSNSSILSYESSWLSLVHSSSFFCTSRYCSNSRTLSCKASDWELSSVVRLSPKGTPFGTRFALSYNALYQPFPWISLPLSKLVLHHLQSGPSSWTALPPFQVNFRVIRSMYRPYLGLWQSLATGFFHCSMRASTAKIRTIWQTLRTCLRWTKLRQPPCLIFPAERKLECLCGWLHRALARGSTASAWQRCCDTG